MLVLCMVVSVFAFAGCGGAAPSGDAANGGQAGGSPYEVVSAAIEKTLKAKSFEANVVTSLKTDLMGNVSETSSDFNIKATAVDTAKPQMTVDGKMEIMESAIPQKFYYDGEWKYFDITENGGYKMACTFEEFSKEVEAPQNIIVALPEELFKDAQSKTGDDGSLTVTVVVDEATMESIYKDAVTAVVYDVVGEDLAQAVTKDASVTVTVADGYVRDFKVSFVCEITAGNDKVTYNAVDSVSLVSCDKDVTVTPPANLDKFYETDFR